MKTKRHIFTVAFLAYLMLFSVATNAQLSGDYTIGGSSPDYVSFAAAQTDLETSGVSGAVVFNIRPGTYIETVGGSDGFGPITGSSATNTITFKPETDGVIISAGLDEDGFFIKGGDFFIIDGLEITGCDKGIKLDDSSSGDTSDNNIIRNCKIHGNDGHLLWMKYSHNNQVYNNLIYNNLNENRNGIYCSRSDNNVFYYNTVYGEFMKYAISFYYGSGEGVGNIFKNNIVFNNDADGTYMAAIRVNDALGIPVSDNNLLYAPSGHVGKIDDLDYVTLSDWQTASSQDANSISADPIFIENNVNLHINTSAAIVDALATPLTGYTTDFDGDTRDATNPDIGADEYTYISALPNAPTDPNPENTATDVIFNTDLAWSGVADTFHIYLWETATGSMLVDNETTTDLFYDIPDLSFDTQYSWRIDAQNTLGTTTGTEWSFTTSTALMGIKTIGGTSPDYPSIEEAINDLNAKGVGTGGVTFLIRDGIYNENDNLFILDVVGTLDNPVIFQPDTDADVTINIDMVDSFSTAFGIHNSDYITFSGIPYGATDNTLKNITINGTRNNDDDVFVFWLAKGSDNCTLTNLNINSISPASDTGWSTPVYVSNYGLSSTVGIDAFTLSNCVITGGSTYGIFFDGEEGKELTNFHIDKNIIKDWQKFGIYLYHHTIDFEIENNEIYQTFDNARSSVYGISIHSTITGTKFHHNYIHDLKHSELAGAKGIYVYGGATNNLIYNNIVHLTPGETANASKCMGVSWSGEGLGNEIYYNTFYMGGVDTRGTNSFCLDIDNEVAGLIVKNNILINERTGGDGTNGHYAFSLELATSCAESDTNFISVNSEDTTDNRYVAEVNELPYNTLADLQAITGKDLNSLTGDPNLNMVNLHLNLGSSCIANATPIAGITTDFDLEIRDTTTPDIGADEYSGSASIAESLVHNELTNYPNPFEQVTTIHFNLYKNSDVLVEIYNTKGQLIETLVNKELAAGNHRFIWDATKATSGLYLYKLRASGKTSTRKMILIK